MSKQEIVDTLKKKSLKAMKACQTLAECVSDSEEVPEELLKEATKTHKMSADVFGKIAIWEALGAPQ